MAQTETVRNPVFFQLQKFGLWLLRLDSLADLAAAKADSYATGEELVEYMESYESEILDLRRQITESRGAILQSGIHVPKSWLSFPVALAVKLSRTDDGRWTAVVDKKLRQKWESISESIDIQKLRLQHDPKLCPTEMTISEPNLIPVKSRNLAPPCPECQGRARVTSTNKRTQYLKCTDEKCGHKFKRTLQQAPVT